MSRWPLAALLSLGTRDEVAARAALAAALAEERTRMRERDAAEEAARARARAWRSAAAALGDDAGAGAAALQARVRHLQRLRAEWEHLRSGVRACDAAVAGARGETSRRVDALAAARAAVRALERHRDGWLAGRDRRRGRLEELADDELVSGRARATR